MRKLAAVIILLFFVFSNLHSQEETIPNVDSVITINPKFGVYFNYGLNLHSPEFQKLPGTYSCCHNYTKGDGKGVSFGVLFDYPLNNDWWVDFRLGYNQLDGLLTSEESTNVIVNGSSQNGIFEHRLDAKIGMINFDAFVNYRLVENLFFGLGAKAGFLISKNYSQIEEVKSPEEGYFEDTGLRTRNYSDGEIKDASAFQAFASAHLSYELPLTRKNFLYLVPELSFAYGFTNLVNGITWKTHLLKGGLSIKYQEPPPPPPPPPAPMAPPVPGLPEPPVQPLISANIKVIQIDTLNNQSEQVKLSIEDFTSFNMRPLLNYIFFDENSSKIPDRYLKITPEQTNNFSYDEVKNMDVLPTYYYVLNIIGKRLRENPKTNITIVGTNSNFGAEENNIALSQARADAVKDYFIKVWSIDQSRMKTEARNLPKEPSNVEEIGGHEENRRVEIITKDTEITEPVVTNDTMRKIPKSVVRFIPEVKSEAGVKNWSFSIRQNGTLLLEKSGNGEVPEYFDWEINEKSPSCPNRGGKVKYTFSYTDKIGQSVQTKEAFINVEQLSIDKKRIEGIEDKEFEFYSLILFDYGRSKLATEHKKTADFVKKRITKDSKVSITGFSDSMGRDEINLRISQERANEFAKRIKIKNAKIAGVGETELLYDNKLPEGRFYCRTVKITIETPITKQGE